MSSKNPYRAAGTFAGDSYIQRSADRRLLKEIHDNQRYPYLSAPRQSGKSSLLVATQRALDPSQFLCTFVDLSPYLTDDYGEFVRRFVHAAARGAGLAVPVGNTEYLEDVFLGWLGQTNKRLVVFIDEVDVLLKAPFKVQFLSAIRSLFNQRATEPALVRLQFVLSGATHPSRLIPDSLRSPFNVGVEIPLLDFTLDEMRLLVRWLPGATDGDTTVADQIYAHTGGSVYLSQLVLERLWEAAGDGPAQLEQVNTLVEQLVTEARSDVHFTTIAELFRREHGLHAQWQRWLAGNGAPDGQTLTDLQLTGLCSRDKPFRNAIYERVFGRDGALDLVTLPSLREQLESAYQTRQELQSKGAETKHLDEEISQLRQTLRGGGEPKAGDFLHHGRYELRRLLGRGGFATVWEAWDRQQVRPVAIKLLHAQLAHDETTRERFFRGARTMGFLDHPAIARIYEPHGEDCGSYFFVMEYLPGSDLQEGVINGRIDRSTGLGIVATVGEALEYAHQKRIVHRDVKPSNILLEEHNQPRLTDFDLVRVLDLSGNTREGSALGTVVYAAPEALSDSRTVDARADIYSLGMTAAFVIRGSALPLAVMRNPAAEISALECSESLKQVLLRATDWDPSKRFATAQAFVDALREVLKPRRRTGQVPQSLARVPVSAPAPTAPAPMAAQGGAAPESAPAPVVAASAASVLADDVIAAASAITLTGLEEPAKKSAGTVDLQFGSKHPGLASQRHRNRPPASRQLAPRESAVPERASTPKRGPRIGTQLIGGALLLVGVFAVIQWKWSPIGKVSPGDSSPRDAGMPISATTHDAAAEAHVLTVEIPGRGMSATEIALARAQCEAKDAQACLFLARHLADQSAHYMKQACALGNAASCRQMDAGVPRRNGDGSR